MNLILIHMVKHINSGHQNGGNGIFLVPSSQHPRENYSPDNCAINQSGPVWFLADGAPVRADS